MLDKLKADFDGILELVNKCPAPLQETAFKMILERWFTANTIPAAPAKPATPGGGGAGAGTGHSPLALSVGSARRSMASASSSV